MRDIEYRAWNFYDKKMYSWEEISSAKQSHTFLWISCQKDEKDNILMQYTGLKDKNDKEIYEGDVYTQGDDNIKYKVIFDEGGFIGNQIGNQSLASLTHWGNVIEIIGNVYENPELLEDNNT
jgi:uncharacterized phage protein (TIGR01671 family)